MFRYVAGVDLGYVAGNIVIDIEVFLICLKTTPVPFARKDTSPAVLLETKAKTANSGEKIDKCEFPTSFVAAPPKERKLLEASNGVGLRLGLSALPAADLADVAAHVAGYLSLAITLPCLLQNAVKLRIHVLLRWDNLRTLCHFFLPAQAGFREVPMESDDWLQRKNPARKLMRLLVAQDVKEQQRGIEAYSRTRVPRLAILPDTYKRPHYETEH